MNRSPREIFTHLDARLMSALLSAVRKDAEGRRGRRYALTGIKVRAAAKRLIKVYITSGAHVTAWAEMERFRKEHPFARAS